MNLNTIPEIVRNEIISELQEKLKLAFEEKESAELRLKIASEKIDGYKTTIDLLNGYNKEETPFFDLIGHIEPKTTVISFESKKLGWKEKVLEVLKYPSKFGFNTFNGAEDLLKAVVAEFHKNDLSLDIDSARRSIAPTISRLIKDGEIVKVKRIGTKADFHQISREWFDEDLNPKKEYIDLLKDFEIINSNE